MTSQMVEQQARWATLIQTCAPGSKVLLVGSHADEVEGGEAVVMQRCRHMAQRVHAELAKYRQTQQRRWVELCREHSVPCSDTASLVETLGDKVKIREWQTRF